MSELVYFIQRGEHGPIKIGKSKNPKRRLINLQISSSDKLHLLCAVQGSGKTEVELHRLFKKHRIRGEWYEPAPDIIDFISKHMPVSRDVAPPKVLPMTIKPGPRSNVEIARLRDRDPHAIMRLEEAIAKFGVNGAADMYGVHRATVWRWVGRGSGGR